MGWYEFKRAVTVMIIATFMAGCGSSSTEKIQLTTPIPAAKAYSDPTLVTDAVSLKASLGKAGTVIIDARSATEFNAGHLPGAQNAIWQSFATVGTGAPGDANWGVLKTPSEIGSALGTLGIDASTEVIVYADAPGGWGDDGRILWMLRMAGVTKSSLLNGGLKAWKSAGSGFTTTATVPTAKSFTLTAFTGNYVVDKNWILANMAGSDVKIIDTRDAEEFSGAIKYGEKRGGHIPGAINLPFNTALFTNDPFNPGIIKSQDALEAVFTAAGIKKTDTIVCYCTKGIRSGLMTMVLRLAGYSKAVNYDASFYEWAGDATLPVQ